MTIIGIDPSFSRTGLCILKESEYTLKSFSVSNGLVYDISETMKLSRKLTKLIMDEVESIKPDIIIIEYPILSTRSGSYLGLIQQAMFDRLCEYSKNNSVLYYLLPAQAVNSVTKAKNKTAIINWCKSHLKITQKINHDEATSAVLTYIADRVYRNLYKNSFKSIQFNERKKQG